MTVEDLVQRVCAAGVVLTPQLHVEGPAGAIPSELRAELAAHKLEILAALLRPQPPGAARQLRDLYAAACFELAETLGWPRLPLDPPVTIVGGEAMWRLFLTKASVPELREQVLPTLQGMIAAIPPPSAGASA